MMASEIDKKIVFSLSPSGTGDGVPLLILGVPRGAWEHMKDGKTHDFDLTSIGLPVKLMLFGGADHDAIMRAIEKLASNQGIALRDERRRDFSIKQEKT